MKKKNLFLGGTLILAIVLYAFSSPVNYGVGDYVSDFKLPNVDGKLISLADFKDVKGFIVIFTCNTCPYAKSYESRIKQLDKKYASKGFPVIAINPNDVTKKPGDSMKEMKKRSSTKSYTFPYLRDDSQQVAKSFGASKTPHTYVLDKKGADKYQVAFIGAIDDSPNDESDVTQTYVEDAIDALLNGKKPTITQKRAIGCTIKWKS